jgi:ParB-like chromosome segregation protein Spo0J
MMVQIRIDDIRVPEGHRPLDQAKVAEIAASIKMVGLLAPIGVQRYGGVPAVLIWGRHRLAACASLGMQTIEAVPVDGLAWDRGLGDADFEDYAKMAEIAENLHRYELKTVLRDELLAKWVAFLEKHGSELGKRNRVPVPRKPGPKPSAAIAAVAKASGKGLRTVKEAVKVSKVSPAVKAAFERADLSQKQRKDIARLATEAEQLAAIEATYNRHFVPPDTRAPTDVSKYADVAEHRATFDQFEVFLKVFAALEARGDAAQVAEAILVLNVNEDTAPRLVRIAAFATKVASIMSSKSKSIAAAE